MGPCYCPTCRLPIRARDIDLTAGVGQCRKCDRIWKIEDIAGRGPKKEPPPPGWSETEEGGGLLLVSRWSEANPVTPAMLLAFGVLLLMNVLLNGLIYGSDGQMQFLGGGLVFFLVFFGSMILINSFGSTEIRVFGGEITVRHSPFGRSASVATSFVRQVYVERVQTYQSGFVWRVIAMGEGKRVYWLLEGRDLEVARWVERRLEAHLGIQDIRVPREYNG